jgi:hypothetical protein
MRRLVLAGLLVLSGCSSSDELGASEKEIARFHTQLDAGQFDAIYAAAAPEWKNVSTQPDTIQLFTGIHNKLGSFVSGTQSGWKVNYGTGGTTIIIVYDSKFEKGDGQETFTFQRSGGSIQLVGYNINSRALITG